MQEHPHRGPPPGLGELASLASEADLALFLTPCFLCPEALSPWTEGSVGSACSQGTLRRPRLTGALLLSGPQSSWGGQPTSPLSIWLQAMATYQLSQKMFVLRIESERQSEV